MKNKKVTICIFLTFLIIGGGLVLSSFITLSTSNFYTMIKDDKYLMFQGKEEDLKLFMKHTSFYIDKSLYFYEINDIKFEEEQYIITLESSIDIPDSIVEVEIENEKIPLIQLFIRCWEEL